MSMPDCIVDCDADPVVFGDWKILSHKKGGKLKWDPKRVQLYLSPSQQGESCINGNNLQGELESAGMLVLNANVLDFLLAHNEFIPEDWKSGDISFWGTIYCDPDYHDLYVRCLSWHKDGFWHWHYRWLNHDWTARYSAACLNIP